MGNSTSESNEQSQILSKFWQPISPNLFRNKLTYQIIKRKKLTFQTQQQMKYVFNCLLKRMNNFNSNVTKVIYLKKSIQPQSVCRCGQRFSIIVFLQHIEQNLDTFIKQIKNRHSFSDRLCVINQEVKCICLNILKGASYLKQRYGPFKLTSNNIWIEQQNIHSTVKQTQSKQYNQSKQASHKKLREVQHHKKYKVKVWISQMQQQNYPDQSCEDAEMCMSLIHLIKQIIVPNKLCNCYSKPEQIHLPVTQLKQLGQAIQKDHQKGKTNYRQNAPQFEPFNPLIKKNINLPTQRQFRSSSMYQPVIQHNNHINLNNCTNQFQRNNFLSHDRENHRKYSSIQYVRKPKEKSFQNMAQINNSEFQFIAPYDSHQIPSNAQQINSNAHQIHSNFNIQSGNKYLSKQSKKNEIKNQNLKPNQHIFNHPNIKIGKLYHSFNEDINKNHQLLNKKQQNIKHENQIYKFDSNFNHQLSNKANFQLVRGAQFFNPKIKIRTNQNNFINGKYFKQQNNQIYKQINNKIKIQQVQNQKSFLKDYEKCQKTQSQRSATQINKHIKIQQISFDKKTNPTDRTKIQILLKDSQKKQISAINSSRKNISITPISLDSTYGAVSSLKPLGLTGTLKNQQLYTNKQQDNQKILDQDISNNQPQSAQNRKQSASSSKSQQGHYTAHQGGSNGQQQKSKFLVKKRLSNQISPCSNQFQQNQQITASKKSLLKASQSRNKLTENNLLIRLRQSQYIVSAQNSFIKQNSKEQFKTNGGKNNSQINNNEMNMKNTSQIDIDVSNINKNKNDRMVDDKIQNSSLKNSNISNSSLMNSKNNSRQNIKQAINSLIDSKQSSMNLNTIQPNMTSLAQMEAQFKTRSYIQEDNNISKDDSNICSQTYQQYEVASPQNYQQKITEIINNKQSSSHSNHSIKLIHQKNNQSEQNQQLKQHNLYNQSAPKYEFQHQQDINAKPNLKFSSNFTIQNQNNQQQKHHIIKISSEDKISSLIMRETQQPLDFIDQQQYVVRISNTIQQNQFYKVHQNHQKKLSNPTHDKSKLTKNKSLKEEFDNLLGNPRQNSFKALSQNKSKMLTLQENQGRQTYSIYNQSEYNNSEKTSKKASHYQVSFKQIPVPQKPKQTNKKAKLKLPLNKEQIQEKMQTLKDSIKKQAKNLLRLTSSGHQDNSIKQKVRNKKAEFAQLKNEMNSLLL